MPSQYELEMMREIAQWQREADQRARVTGRPATRITALRTGGRVEVDRDLTLRIVQPPSITDGTNSPDAE